MYVDDIYTVKIRLQYALLYNTHPKLYCVCKQNNRPSGISRLASLLVGLTAGTY